MPIIAITGPRQSGKTTLAKAIFHDYEYVSLENLNMRTLAQQDPQGFLKNYDTYTGVILDEVQQVPELFSYLQGIVDEKPRPGFYILTGSQHFLLSQAISQTLAGRIAIFTLLPFSIVELEKENLLSTDANQTIFTGFYPRIFEYQLQPAEWYPGYIQTYIERDVRNITRIVDLSQFQNFLTLCAGRIGQLLNISSLANDAGVSVQTARAWLSLLEASYIIYFLHPHYKNFSKRLIKSPKLYFYDTGVACSLLEIEDVQQMMKHYLRGGLFESMIITELMKESYNHNRRPHTFFWRDKSGHEVDCIIEKSTELFPIEIKAGATAVPDYFEALEYWNKLAQADPSQSSVIYAGDKKHTFKGISLFGWRSIHELFDKIFK
ncbi:MAG: hypothetical protein US13_C0014G0007 [candidate division TM6 bacterium GW2011_GWE2_36_25]|nr:MAG: hypothetical protein US03_C0013G0007 [candidate division TM6 bacterium GW2011_GWF2_36_131]KKQ02550.1 MAG: hypothetical protein US13_C0014G0007 [candidate division TM6 bacterium GW2011_GWE2_36_25]KKQ19305.1 MAG: hypothetical protein US32_C0011G0007 [candidate division TM6 bacterium GW2011_GWA2_36_9]